MPWMDLCYIYVPCLWLIYPTFNHHHLRPVLGVEELFFAPNDLVVPIYGGYGGRPNLPKNNIFLIVDPTKVGAARLQR